MITEDCKNKLLNYKFKSAAEKLSSDDMSDEAAVIKNLSDTFDNCGWINGSMGNLIQFIVNTLIK